MAEDDALWPQTDRVGRQELEIVIGDKHRAETPTVTIIITSFITHLIVVGSALFLLSRPGSQVPGVLAHRTAFQDQPNLSLSLSTIKMWSLLNVLSLEAVSGYNLLTKFMFN